MVIASPLQIHEDIAFVSLLQGQWTQSRGRNATHIIYELSEDFDNANTTVLDIGCGSGRMAQIYKHAKYRGMDTSHRFLQICKGLGLDVQFGSVYKIPLGNNAIDLVLCHAVLFHIGDFVKAVNELWRVTKRRLIFSAYYSKWQRNHRGAQPVLVEDHANGNSWFVVTNIIPRWQIKRLARCGLRPLPHKCSFIWYDGTPEDSNNNIVFVILDR